MLIHSREVSTWSYLILSNQAINYLQSFSKISYSAFTTYSIEVFFQNWKLIKRIETHLEKKLVNKTFVIS